jgi:alginate O-acetyltransferase complex protein AlgI
MFRTIINLFVVWFLTGLWHGASWNFVLWGLYFFVFIMLERLFLQKVLVKAPKIIPYIYSFIVVYFGWILFKYEDMGTIGSILRGMFCLNGNTFSSFETRTHLLSYLFFIIAVMFAFTPLFKNLYTKIFRNENANTVVRVTGSILEIVYPIVVVLLSALALIGDSYNPFLYFQF